MGHFDKKTGLISIMTKSIKIVLFCFWVEEKKILIKKKVQKMFGPKMGSKEILGPRNFEYKKFWVKKSG